MVQNKKTKLKLRKSRYYFFLNPYNDDAFTKCPKCLTRTLIRKFPLVIHIEPRQVFILNKKCRYCPRCELIIARKSDVENMMVAGFEYRNPAIIGNDYLVVGTLEKSDWRARDKIDGDVEVIERMHAFKDHWVFEPVTPKWCLTEK